MERSCFWRAWVDEIEAVPLMDGMMMCYMFICFVVCIQLIDVNPVLGAGW